MEAVVSAGPRSRWRKLRGLVLAAVAVLITLSLAGAGYAWFSEPETGCRKTVTTTVAASPDQAPVMADLAERWNSKAPQVGKDCVRVAVLSSEPAKIAAALAPSWDVGRDGPRPDVWAPDALAWTQIAAARPEAIPLLPAKSPSIATSAIVLALPRSMAEAMGWPARQVTMPELLGAMATGKSWGDLGHREWGAIRFGMTDPTRSAAALYLLISVMDRNADGQLSNVELTASVAFASSVTSFPPSAKALLDEAQRGTGAQGSLTTAVAFPTDEYSLSAHRASDPALDHVPVYLGKDGVFADHPFVTLTAPWVDDTRSGAAAKFRDFLLSPEGQRSYGAAGFRGADRSTTNAPLLAKERGFAPDLRTVAKTPDAAAVNQVIAQWSLLQRPINVLILLDTSGSMNERIPQLNVTRLQLLQQAAVRGIGLLNNVSSMGLWQFSSALTPGADHREVVPIGVATERIGPLPRRQALIKAIQELKAGGGTGLYDTTAAGYERMQKAWRAEAVNMVMVITDGKNEDDAGLSEAQLIAKLRAATRPDRPIPILGIAVGPAADAAAMQRISQVTGGRTFAAKNDAEVIEQLVLAFAGRLR